MNIYPFSEYQAGALVKWREYTKAAKVSKDPIYKDLKKVYHQLKQGRKVIDIQKVITKAGLHSNNHPKLAITQAKNKHVWCRYKEDGTLIFTDKQYYSWGFRKSKWHIELVNCFPRINNRMDLKAPVPLIPPTLLPAKLTDDYFILWEVDVWEMVPPLDPYLLRRLSPNMFVVVAGWDLTEVERAAMAGRMH